MNYSNDYVYNAIIDLLDHALIMNGLRSIYQSIILSYIYICINLHMFSISYRTGWCAPLVYKPHESIQNIHEN